MTLHPTKAPSQLLTCPQCEFFIEETQPRFCCQCRMPLTPIVGKYQIRSKLGSGGGGTVYLAHHLHLNLNPQRVIKILHSHLLQSPTALRRFAKEIEVTSVLSQSNEHIVRIYDDFGSIPGLGCFYVMEYLKGQSLFELIGKHPEGLPLPLALHIFGQLCAALSHVHNAGVVHRDLKPQNVFLEARRGDPHFVKLMDFGIVRSEQTPITAGLEGVVGTPVYMPPEQRHNRGVDARADIYALGVILYQMLCGVLPFAPREEENVDLPPSRWSPIPVPLSERMGERAAQVPEALEAAVMQALEEDPKARFQDAEAFRAAVWSSLGIAPKAPSTRPHASSFKAWALGGALCGGLLAAALLAFGLPPFGPSRSEPASRRPLAKTTSPPPAKAPTPTPIARRPKQPAPPKAAKAPRKSAKRRPHRRTKRRLRSTPKRAKVVVLRVPAAPKRPQTPGCPADPKGGRWIFFALRPTSARVKTTAQVLYRGKGICILHPTRGSLELRITSSRHQPCRLERAFSNRLQRIQLRPNQGLSLDENLSYCLQGKK